MGRRKSYRRKSTAKRCKTRCTSTRKRHRRRRR